MKTIQAIIIILFFGFSSGFSNDSNIIYDNHVYDDGIKSVQVIVNGTITSMPVLRLKSNDYFVIQFDCVEDIERDVFYRFIHCDRDWKPSKLNELDYLTGFNDFRMRDFQYSINTKVQYTHYYGKFPNRDVDFRISGNFILYLYDNYDGSPILTRRIMIAEQLVSPMAEFAIPNDVSNLRFKQQLNMKVNVGNNNFINPPRSITATVVQNGNWLTAVNSVEPRFFANNELIFDQFGQIDFFAGREFRNFDTRSILGRGIRLQRIERNQYGTDVFLFMDRPRSNQVYLFYFDFNGNFFIDNRDRPGFMSNEQRLANVQASDSLKATFIYRNPLIDGEFQVPDKDIMADYTNVHFTYESRSLGDVYVFGAFTDWKLLPEYKLNYDVTEAVYYGNFLLKQGFYDYSYVAVTPAGGIDFMTTEGSWQDTENDYTILIYMRQVTDIYDRLIGFSRLNTRERFN
jgi:hypothetical protein